MRKRTRIVTVAAAVLSLASACDRHHRSPTEPTGPTGSAVSSIDVTGQTSLANPGDTTQLTAILRSPDGTTRDVTAEATWRVTDGDVASLEAPGLFRARRYGSTMVEVTIGSPISRWTTLRVSPPDTFLVSGSVRSEEGDFLPEMQVELESTAGAFSGRTDSGGIYFLPGRGAGILRVSGEGFETAETSLTVLGDMSHGETLVERAGKHSIGTYRVTITASRSCDLPSAAMQRTFDADVLEAGEFLYVLPTTGEFVTWGGHAGFAGTHHGSSVEFRLSSDYWDCNYSLCEQIPGVGDLSFDAVARGSMGADGISAILDGKLEVNSVSCNAADHQLEMVPVGAS